MKTVSAAQMRKLDRRTIDEAGIPGKVLMERAGTGAAEHILEFTGQLNPDHRKRFILLAGKGNNGGDAYVIARVLAERTNAGIRIYSACKISDLKGDAFFHAKILPESVIVEVKKTLSADDFKAGDIIVDGLLGTGISGPLRPPYENWIETVNQSNLPVIALDIPSGMNCDDGTFEDNAIKADLTVTMGLPKTGMLLNQGPEYCGQIRMVDIGIPEDYIQSVKGDSEFIMENDIRELIGRIPVESHKNSRGRVLVLGGCRFYPGAPCLCAGAALRSGAGLVIMSVPETAPVMPVEKAIIFRWAPDAGEGYFTRKSLDCIRELAEDMDAIVCGPGIGRNSSAFYLLEYLNSIEAPVVYDADALNLVAMRPEVFQRQGVSVLTPHPGEMKRLLKGFKLSNYLKADRTKQAVKLAEKTGAIVVLKGHQSVIADPKGRIAINSSGSPALSTAGSGDVLSGITGAFLAQGDDDDFKAVCAAVFIHGLAGELSGYGMRGTIADDLPRLIPEAMKRISPFT